jgi:hypothetical protein
MNFKTFNFTALKNLHAKNKTNMGFQGACCS